MHNRAVLDRIGSTLPERFHALEASADGPLLFSDSVTGLAFVYVEGGRCHMGLSEDEELAASEIADPFPATVEEMRPTHMVTVPPMLASVTPVLNVNFNKILSAHTFPPDQAHYPAYVRRDKAEAFVRQSGCALPTEEQWEYACRAGTTTLFCVGDSLPDEAELARWLEWDLSEPEQLPANGFGLRGLFFGEWCRDQYRPNYESGTPATREVYAVRGGGAFFWPWQDEEWVWCVSAMRMPSSDLPDSACAFRLVFELPGSGGASTK
jgi:formylglycine-generating enzyme required for sulfatase activity